MRKLLRYANGDEYITGGMVGIEPNGIEPEEILDLDTLNDEEFKNLMKNKKDKKILGKVKKIK